ncbi:MAG: hypothetical protein JW863_09785 [Chitinispirillaceae bacterium]|nr:hypothetical protein [Chitinispirillaceae bacterium]
MKKETILTATGRLYAEAYGKHYEAGDLYGALMLYSKIVDEYPEAGEATNSRSQIQNIVHKVVPGEVLYTAQLKLAVEYLDPDTLPDHRSTKNAIPAPELSIS